jgi:uncharacterized protein (DUF849 family)
VGDTTGASELVPVTPQQIANAALEAAGAGAAVAHIHVRDPTTGKGARDVALYRDVVERIRSADADVVINLSAGMGGDLVLGGDDAPLPLDPEGTDVVGASERLAHVEALLPEICTLDCGSLNFAAGGDYVLLNTPGILRAMARRIRELGVRPELEVFDTGHLVMVRDLIDEGLIEDPVLIQLCMGIPTAPRTTRRPSWHWSTSCPPAACSRRSRSAACSCRTSPWQRWPAATCGSGSRTTFISRAVCSRPMPSSLSGQSASLPP